MRAGRATTARRPRGVLVTTGIGVVLVVLVAAGLFLPLVGFLAGATASTVGLVPFPGLSVTLVSLLGAAVGAGLLFAALTRRRTATAIAWTVLAVVVALAGTAVPLIAVVTGSADRASDLAPIIGDLWGRLTGQG